MRYWPYAGSLNPSALARLLGEWNLGTAPAYRELADVVRLLVLDGRIPLDMALPSERALAAALGLSRTTVTAAYAQLREQGFLSTGQGSRARTCIPHQGSRGSHPAGALNLSGAPGLAVPAGILDLAYASLPASGEVVHRAFAAALTELPALLPGFGYDALGVGPLREAIAARYTASGVPDHCAPDPGDLGRPARPEHHPAHPRGPVGQGPGGAPELPERPRCHPRRGLPARPGGHAAGASGRRIRTGVRTGGRVSNRGGTCRASRPR